MNCLTARAILLADPDTQSIDLTAHLEICPNCRGFSAEVARDDALLRRAIDVPVPRELAARIMLQAQLKQRRADPLSRLRDWFDNVTGWRGAALACALSAVLFVALSMVQPSRAPELNWGQVALAHALAEPAAAASQAVLPRHALATALQDYGLALKGDLGVIRFVEHCPVPGGRGTHIVIETPKLGTVTLLLAPPRERTGRGTARGEGLAARTVDIIGVNAGVVASESADLTALAAFIAGRIVAPA